MGEIWREGFEWGTPAVGGIVNGWTLYISTISNSAGGRYAAYGGSIHKDANGQGGSYCYEVSGRGQKHMRRAAREVWINWYGGSTRNDGNNGGSWGFLAQDTGTAQVYWQHNGATSMRQYGGGVLRSTSGPNTFIQQDGIRHWRQHCFVDQTSGFIVTIKDEGYDSPFLQNLLIDTQSSGSDNTVFSFFVNGGWNHHDDMAINDCTLKVSAIPSSGTLAVDDTVTGNVSGTTCDLTSLIDGSLSGDAVIQMHNVDVGGTGTPTTWEDPDVDPWASDVQLRNGSGWVANIYDGTTNWLDNVDATGFIGNATIATLNGLTPAAGDTYVTTDAGTPTAGTSDAMVAGSVAQYDGTSWIEIVTGSGGFVASGVRLQITTTGTALISPLTDTVDEGKIANFDGTSLSPSSLDTPVANDGFVIGAEDGTVQGAQNELTARVFTGTVPSGTWGAYTIPTDPPGFQTRNCGPPKPSVIVGLRTNADTTLAKITMDTEGTIPAGVAFATDTFTLTGVPNNGDSMELDGTTYTWVTPFVDAANNVFAEVDAATCIDNLILAMTGGAGAGTKYGTGTTAQTETELTDGGSSMTATCRVAGTLGNAITSSVGTNVSGTQSWANGGSGLAGGTLGAYAYFPAWPNSLNNQASYMEADLNGEKYLFEIEALSARGISSSKIGGVLTVELGGILEKLGTGLENARQLIESGGTEYEDTLQLAPSAPDTFQPTYLLGGIPDGTLELTGTELTVALIDALRIGAKAES